MSPDHGKNWHLSPSQPPLQSLVLHEAGMQWRWRLKFSWDDGERPVLLDTLWITPPVLFRFSQRSPALAHSCYALSSPQRQCLCAVKSWGLDLSHLLHKLRPAGTCCQPVQNISSKNSELISMPVKNKKGFCLSMTGSCPTWTWWFHSIVSVQKMKSLKNIFFYLFQPISTRWSV